MKNQPTAKRATFVSCIVKLPEKEENTNEDHRGLQAWPEPAPDESW